MTGPRCRAGELSGLALEILRQAGRPLTPGQVLDRLQSAGSGPLAYTTVVTILSRLVLASFIDGLSASDEQVLRQPLGAGLGQDPGTSQHA